MCSKSPTQNQRHLSIRVLRVPLLPVLSSGCSRDLNTDLIVRANPHFVVADPHKEDCPIIFASAGFHKLTGTVRCAVFNSRDAFMCRLQCRRDNRPELQISSGKRHECQCGDVSVNTTTLAECAAAIGSATYQSNQSESGDSHHSAQLQKRPHTILESIVGHALRTTVPNQHD